MSDVCAVPSALQLNYRNVCDRLDDAADGGESRGVASRNSETPQRCAAPERRPANSRSDPPPTKPRHGQSRHPRHGDDLSPRLTAAPADTPDVRRRHTTRVDDTVHVQPAAVSNDPSSPARRASRRPRSTTSPQPLGGGAPRQQPQPITSIHFDSAEIDSTLPGTGADVDDDDDGVAWGLDADRCTFETTFPVSDRRRRETPARLPALSDDYVDDGHDRRPELVEEHANQQQQPGQALSRWRTLEDVHRSSTSSLVVPDDDGRGDAEGLRGTQPKRRRNASAEPGLHRRRAKPSRSTSVPNRSIVGFYADTDWDSTDDGHDEHRRRGDDGAGDRRTVGGGAELLELEVGSDDWLEMRREIHRSQSRAERLTNPPSPRKTIPPLINRVPSRSDSQQVPGLTAPGTAARTVVASRRNEVPRQFCLTAVPATNSTSGKQPTAGKTKPDQATNSSLGFNDGVETLLIALLIIILLGGIVYTYASRLDLKQLPPTETPQWNVSELAVGYITEYLTAVFD